MIGTCFLLACLVTDSADVPKVGDVYTVEQQFLCSLSPLWVEDFGKALAAGDREGIKEMVKEGKVGGIKSGWTMRILDVAPQSVGGRFACMECRVLDENGRSVGKVFVFSVYFDPSKRTLTRQKDFSK